MIKTIKMAKIFVVLLLTFIIFNGCSKKISSLKGSLPSSSVQEVKTTKNVVPEEVVTEPPAAVNPSITENAIEPNDSTQASATSEKPEEISALTKGSEKETLKGNEKETSISGIKDIFFDYNAAILKGDEIDILKKNAELLKQNKGANLRIEGYADERGTSEYNLALGEKRAQIVKKYLSVFGVPKERIDTVSYGKEKAFCKEHNEECWAQNRRGHFVVVNIVVNR